MQVAEAARGTFQLQLDELDLETVDRIAKRFHLKDRAEAVKVLLCFAWFREEEIANARRSWSLPVKPRVPRGGSVEHDGSVLQLQGGEIRIERYQRILDLLDGGPLSRSDLAEAGPGDRLPAEAWDADRIYTALEWLVRKRKVARPRRVRGKRLYALAPERPAGG